MKGQRTLRAVMCFVVMAVIAGLIAGGGCGGPAGQTVTPGEEPVYGGTLNLFFTTDAIGFDDAVRTHHLLRHLRLTHDLIWEGDWAKGNAGGYGSGETGWFVSGDNRLDMKAGGVVAEVEWDLADQSTVILHVRQGVHWHDKPPTNGRELTADDIVFSMERQYTLDTGYQKLSYSWVAETIEISAIDDYTVLIEIQPEHIGDLLGALDFMHIYPRDAVEEFGDMNDWQTCVGSGPFILEDYVPGSTMTFVRFDNYWGKNLVGPGEGDQLPYLDEVKVHIVPDESTQDANFRTGKLDIMFCDWERAGQFLPMADLEHAAYQSDTGYVISMRQDIVDSPFADVRVRQALALATDNQKILDEYYGGEGALLTWPISPVKGYEDAYMPLEELPEHVKELYEYHPEEAKQLLAAAGYPNGFATTIVCQNTRLHIDVLSIIASMWEEVGIELVIDAKDYATYQTLAGKRSYDGLFFGGRSGAGGYYKARNFTGTAYYNTSHIDDPVCNQAREDMAAAYPDEAGATRIHRELMPYLLEQCYTIPIPQGYEYVFWWPWVRNYSGEVSVGYYDWWNYSKYPWIDQDLKESMGH